MTEPMFPWNASLIDGRGGQPLERATVTLADGRISSIGEARDEPPSDAGRRRHTTRAIGHPAVTDERPLPAKR